MPPSAFSDLMAAIRTMMVTHDSIFEQIGYNVFHMLAVYTVMRFGVSMALGKATKHDMFVMMASIVGVRVILQYYSQPIPGFGISFYHLIIDEGDALAAKLQGAMVEDIFARLNLIYFGLESPGISVVINLVEGVRWFFIVLGIMLLEASVFFVISLGYIASAIGILIGPLMIPWVLVPQLKWIFWGWLKAFIQYAFYPVVANACVFVLGSMLISFTDVTQPPYDGVKIAKLFLPLCMFMVAGALIIFKIPSICSSYWTGSAGEATSWR